MDRSFDTVIHFQVKFWQLVLLVGTGFFDISQRTSIDNVTNNEALDGLVFRDGFARADTANAVNMAASVFITSVIASLDSHVAATFSFKFCKSTRSKNQVRSVPEKIMSRIQAESKIRVRTRALVIMAVHHVSSQTKQKNKTI
jgi:hypothetical protein